MNYQQRADAISKACEKIAEAGHEIETAVAGLPDDAAKELYIALGVLDGFIQEATIKAKALQARE